MGPEIKGWFFGRPDGGEGVPAGGTAAGAGGESEHVRVLSHGDDVPQDDHAIPRSVGGNATIENAQTTYAWCNASKGARDFPVNPLPEYEGPWPPEWWGIGP